MRQEIAGSIRIGWMCKSISNKVKENKHEKNNGCLYQILREMPPNLLVQRFFFIF